MSVPNAYRSWLDLLRLTFHLLPHEGLLPSTFNNIARLRIRPLIIQNQDSLHRISPSPSATEGCHNKHLSHPREKTIGVGVKLGHPKSRAFSLYSPSLPNPSATNKSQVWDHLKEPACRTAIAAAMLRALWIRRDSQFRRNRAAIQLHAVTHMCCKTGRGGSESWGRPFGERQRRWQTIPIIPFSQVHLAVAQKTGTKMEPW